MDDKVKYYPYDDYAEGVDQMPDDADNGYQDDGGARKGSDKSVKTLIGILVAVLLVFVILLGVFVAMKKKKDATPAGSNNVATVTDAVTTEKVTTEADLYPLGEYTVTAEGSVRLREDHSTESKHIMSVPNGTKLTITEVYVDSAATAAEEKFWGKTDYKGWTAWVALAYLTRSSSAGAEGVTAEGETGAVVPGTTAAGETTTKSGSSTGALSTGKYVVTADEFLRVREDHDVDSDALTQIDAGEEITILEVYQDTDADDETLEYWGKVSYDGYVGWVAMHYTAPVN